MLFKVENTCCLGHLVIHCYHWHSFTIAIHILAIHIQLYYSESHATYSYMVSVIKTLSFLILCYVKLLWSTVTHSLLKIMLRHLKNPSFWKVCQHEAMFFFQNDKHFHPNLWNLASKPFLCAKTPTFEWFLLHWKHPFESWAFQVPITTLSPWKINDTNTERGYLW